MSNKEKIQSDLAVFLEAETLFKNQAQEYADKSCPFKVGDVAVCCRTHRGKKMEVTKVSWKVRMSFKNDLGKEVLWSVEGKVIKNDGSVGLAVCQYDESDYNVDMRDKSK